MRRTRGIAFGLATAVMAVALGAWLLVNSQKPTLRGNSSVAGHDDSKRADGVDRKGASAAKGSPPSTRGATSGPGASISGTFSGTQSQPPAAHVDPAPGANRRSLLQPTQSGMLFPDTEVGRALQRHLENILAAGRGSEERYKASLAYLRAHAGEALPALDRAYDALPASERLARQGVVETIADLGTHASEPTLTKVAVAPLPAFDNKLDPESYFQREEGSIRYTALEGLRDLARRGNEHAEDTLRGLIVSGPPTLKQEAVAMYLDAGPDSRSRQAEAAALLPPEERWMVSKVVARGGEDIPEQKPDTSGRPKHEGETHSNEKTPPAQATASPAPGATPPPK
jgi:hypothetical protein